MDAPTSKQRLYKGEFTISGEPRNLQSTSHTELFEGDSLTSNLMRDELLERYSHELLSQIISDCKARGVQIIEEAEGEAATLLDHARAEADRTVAGAQSRFALESARLIGEANATAQREADAIRKAARDDVYKAYEGALASFKNAVKQILDARAEHLAAIEREIVPLVGTIVRKLILREMSLDSAIVAEIVGESLKYFDSRATLVVRVAPEHYRILTSDPLFADRVGELGLGAHRIELAPDAKLKPGAVVVTDRFVEYTHDIDRLLESVLAEAEARLNNLQASSDT
jgi:flagellar assembly protein FliH